MQIAEWFPAVLFLDPVEAVGADDADAEPHPAAATLGAHLAMTDLIVVLSGTKDVALSPSLETRIDCKILVGGSR